MRGHRYINKAEKPAKLRRQCAQHMNNEGCRAKMQFIDTARRNTRLGTNTQRRLITTF